jgi:hypothetical protein
VDQVFKILCTRFNAQDSRIILVVVQVEAMKIHEAAVEALKKKKDRMKLNLPQNLWFFK